MSSTQTKSIEQRLKKVEAERNRYKAAFGGAAKRVDELRSIFVMLGAAYSARREGDPITESQQAVLRGSGATSLAARERINMMNDCAAEQQRLIEQLTSAEGDQTREVLTGRSHEYMKQMMEDGNSEMYEAFGSWVMKMESEINHLKQENLELKNKIKESERAQ